MSGIVLMYHRIEDSNKKHVSNLSYIYKIKGTLVSGNNLDSDIKNLHKNGWKHLPIEKFLKTRNKKVFHITFDDGYREQLNIAVPILLKNKIRSATFFVSTCTLHKNIIPLPFDIVYFNIAKRGLRDTLRRLRLNQDLVLEKSLPIIKNYINELDLEENVIMVDKFDFNKKEIELLKSQYLAKKDIKKLSSLGFNIGSHGVTHRNYVYYIDNSRMEISNSKMILESIIKKDMVDFCFPDGKYSQKLVNICKKAGFRNLFVIHKKQKEQELIARTLVTPYGILFE